MTARQENGKRIGRPSDNESDRERETAAGNYRLTYLLDRDPSKKGFGGFSTNTQGSNPNRLFQTDRILPIQNPIIPVSGSSKVINHLSGSATLKVGDPDGFAALSERISSDRRATSSSPIDIPFRHRILHGRNLGYTNLVGSTKSFALLLAMRSWVLQVINGKQFTEPPIYYIDYDHVRWDDVLNAIVEAKDAIIEYQRSRSSGSNEV